MSKISKRYLNVKARRRFYLRFFCATLIMILLLFTFKSIFNKSFAFSLNEEVIYRETGTVDYKIYLKENEFYDKPYLEKNMAYIASLINKVNVDFMYKFNVDRKSNLDIKYSIIGNLVIQSQNNSNTFFEKKYVLTEDKKDVVKDGSSFTISESVSIDYDKYNNLVNKFRTNYAVNTSSYLDVYLQVEEKNKSDNSYKISNVSKTSLKIPLSQQEININLNDQRLDNEQKIISNEKFVVKNEFLLIVSIVLFVITFVYFVRYICNFIKLLYILNMKDNKYDKFINKILKGYDRIIVNVKTAVNPDNYNVIYVTNFQELVDVRDNVKEPINYFIIEEHQSSIFYLIHNEDLYLYMVSLDDFVEEKPYEKE